MDGRMDGRTSTIWFPQIIFKTVWRILTKLSTDVPWGDTPERGDFWPDPTTAAPPGGHNCSELCNWFPQIIFKTAWRILTKLSTDVPWEDAPARGDFRPDQFTAAPPGGHNCSELCSVDGNWFPQIIFKTTWGILTKLSTDVPWKDMPARGDFRTITTTPAPPVGQNVFKIVYNFGFRHLSSKPLDGFWRNLEHVFFVWMRRHQTIFGPSKSLQLP